MFVNSHVRFNVMHIVEAVYIWRFESRMCFIENRCLADDYVQLFELELNFSQSVEIAEKQSLKQLKVFLKRCIDVIEFIKIITEDFDQIQKQLN